MRDVKPRDVEHGAKRDVLQHVSEEDGARTRTAWAELGSKDKDGLGSKDEGRLRERGQGYATGSNGARKSKCHMMSQAVRIRTADVTKKKTWHNNY